MFAVKISFKEAKMIQVLFLTKQDIAKASKKLEQVHNVFKKPEESEAILDFAGCLKSRLKQGTAKDFLIACELASNDLSDPEKVPETYDNYTIGVIRDMANIFAEKMFGKDFAEEVRQFMDIRELI